ncbi:MAG TPA: hypothetical protein PK685_00640 [archaeon]|nr:hypothetical protein [archaeon]
MFSINLNQKKKALEPLIATILLIVVSVILVTIVLTWGKNFSVEELNKTNNIIYVKSDISNYIQYKTRSNTTSENNILEIKNIHPTETATIVGYKILSPNSKFRFLDDYQFSLDENATLSPGQSIFLGLACTPEQTFNVELLTSDSKYIFIKYNSLNSSPASCIKDMDFGWHHACVVLATGKVKCWGRNDNGQLGDGTIAQKKIPIEVLDINSGVAITAGDLHTCVVLSSGEIKCFGDNPYGQLGNQNTTDSNFPVTVLGINNAIKVSGGCWHTCALLNTGEINCWGANTNGQLGNGTKTNSLIPVSVIDSNNDIITNFVDVKVGCTNSCALLNNGQIMCWGNNQYGKLGDGTTTDKNTATPVLNVENAMQISIGSEYGGCLREHNGTVKCWGRNNFGQIGDGTNTDQNTPTQVLQITDAIDIDSGNGHNCAVLSNNELKCWGQNSAGQLGDDTWVNKSVPTTTVNLIDSKDVVLGDEFSCVKSIYGELRCFGSNGQGQLGLGNTTASKVPLDINNSFYD